MKIKIPALQTDALKETAKRLWHLAAGTALILLAVFCGWQTWLISTRANAEQKVHQAQDQVVSNLAAQFKQFDARIGKALESGDIRADLAQGAEGRAAAAKTAAALLPNAKTVVFYGPTLKEVVAADYNKFGYSRAAQLLAAQSSDQLQPFQARRDGNSVVITLVRTVGAQDDPLGYAWVELPFGPVRNLFYQVDIGNGRLDLRLGDDADGLLLYSYGKRAARVPDAAMGKPIPGTRLRVMAALPEAWIVLPKSMTTGIALTVLSLLGALVLFWLRYQSGKPAREEEPEEVTLSNVVEQEKKEQAGTAVQTGEKAEPAQAAAPEHGAAVDRSIFRAYDIRGVVGKSLDEGVARLIGQAIGSVMHDKNLSEIVVGRDGRLSGPDMVEGLEKGLREAGIDVIDIGAVPTPLVYFAAYHFNTGCGVAVTGSHNPPDYNGFKIVVGGETLSEGAIQDLYERIAENRLQSGGMGELKRLDVVGEYVDRIADDVQAERPLKVVVDAGNGIAGAIGPQVLQAIGCQVVPLYCDVDGEFPNHHPDPSDPANLQDLILSVKSTSADIGLAFDGDGDRLGVVTREGEVIFPDRLLMLFARDVLTRNPGATIIYDVKCTGHLQSDILNAGGSPLMWRTGHSLIKSKMRETEALLAGEMSGHFFFRERWYGFDDGIYSAARLMEILAGDPEERSAEEIFATLPKGVSTPELKIEMNEGEHYAFIKKFRDKAEFEGARLTTIDGLRADWKDGWGLVRASNTTPVLVLRFDADNDEALKRIQQAFREQLLAVDPDLKLPF